MSSVKQISENKKVITFNSGKQVILVTGVYPVDVNTPIEVSGLDDALLGSDDIQAIQAFQADAPNVITDDDTLGLLVDAADANQH